MRISRASIVVFVGGLAFAVSGLLPLLSPAKSDFSKSVTVEKYPLTEAGRFDLQVQGVEQDTPAETAVEGLCSAPSADANLRHKVDLLKLGQKFLQSVDDYTVKLRKQEVVKGELLEEQTISLKCRHQPFSVYLLWLTGDTGREVLYIEGQNDGKMIAHDGGWKARIPAFSLTTDGMLAMRDARHPVTTAGILNFLEQMLEVHEADLQHSNFTLCVVDIGQSFCGRICDVFTTEYKSEAESPEYRKSITFVDKEWNIPLHSQHFEWPKEGLQTDELKLDQVTLVESYSFTDIRFDHDLTDHDFDRTNKEYHFR